VYTKPISGQLIKMEKRRIKKKLKINKQEFALSFE
jgi:hypothetical protein